MSAPASAPSSATRRRWRPCVACVRRGLLLALALALGAAVTVPVATQPAGGAREVVGPAAAPAPAGSSGSAAPARDTPVSTVAATATPATAAPTPVFEFAPATLPAARAGQRYGPLPLVRHDGAAVVFAVDGDLEASGLAVSADGVLGGEAVRAGRYRFTLTLVGAPGVSAPLRQSFTLQVRPAAGATAPAPTAAPAPPTPVQVPRKVLDQLPTLPEGRHVRSWKLGVADIERLVETTVEAAAAREAQAQREAGWEPVPGAEPSAAAVAAGARLQQQLQAALAGLLDVEYATASQFSTALAQQVRAACLKLVDAAAAAQGRDSTPLDRAACDAPAAPSTPPAASPQRAGTAPGAAPAMLTLQQARQELLPDDLLQTITTLAVRRHTLAQARPVRWTGEGCGCVLVQRENLVYGLLPFWHPGTDEQPMQVDFSAHERIGYLAALLENDGRVSRAAGWDDEHPDGLVRALRHGTQLDLVVYRSDWGPLLALQGQAREQALNRAVDELTAMVQTPLRAWWRPWVRAALPGWPQPTHLYSGLTLHFDDMPPGEASQRWLVDMVKALVPRLAAAGRGLSLQVVVRGEKLARPEGIALAVRLLELTGSLRPAGDTDIDQGARRTLRPRVPTRLLVLLDEPTTETKKTLREALDRSAVLRSHQRVDFMGALLPMMAHPAGEQPAAMTDQQAFQFDADLAYHDWQYGGAGLWPVADASRGAGAQAVQLLHRNMRNSERLWKERWRLTHRVCDAVCPQRTAWRLVLHGLLLLGGVSLAAFVFSCRVRAIGLPMVVWMWGGLAATGGVFWLLLTCDPALHNLSESNVPLVALFSAGLLGALWMLVQRRVPAP
jgi:hypothetical protein